jgi:hypothetical protein
VRFAERFALVGALCAAAVITAAPARAAGDGGSSTGFTGFGLGSGLARPLGTEYVTLGNAVQYAGDVYITSGGLGQDYPWRFTGLYSPFSVKNVPLAAANLGVMAVLGGIEIHAPGSFGKVAPYFGVQIGAGYEFLTFPGTSNNSQNATIAFAARILPGLEVPLGQVVSFMVEVPVLALLGKSSNVLGGTTSMLRFHL